MLSGGLFSRFIKKPKHYRHRAGTAVEISDGDVDSMKPPNFGMLRRRSTGQLPHEMLQQLGVGTDQPNHMTRIDEDSPASSPETPPKYYLKKKSLELPPSEAASVGSALQKYLLKKRSSLDLNSKDVAKVKASAKMSSSLSSSTSSLVKKKKSSVSSLKPPMIGSRSSSPCRDRSRSPNFNDASDSDTPSGVPLRVERASSSASRHSKTLWHHTSSSSLASMDLTAQRDLSYEEEIEIHVTKLTAAANHWREKYRLEASRGRKLQATMAESEANLNGMIKTIREQYESQLFQMRDKLITTIETADAILIDNQRLDDQLKSVLDIHERKMHDLEQRIARDTSTIAGLRRHVKDLEDKCEQYDQEQNAFIHENKRLIEQVMSVESELKNKSEQVDQKWEDYYSMLLELALSKLGSIETSSKHKRKAKVLRISRTPLKDSDGKTSKNGAYNAGSHSTESINSLTSLESLLTDMSEVLAPRTAPAVFSSPGSPHTKVDFNDNVTDTKRHSSSATSDSQLVSTSRSISSESQGHRRSRNDSDALSSSAGSEYSMKSYLRSRLASRNSPREIRKRFSGISTSFSDSNICDIDPSAPTTNKKYDVLSGGKEAKGRSKGDITPLLRRKRMAKANSDESYDFVDGDEVCLSDAVMRKLPERINNPRITRPSSLNLTKQEAGSPPFSKKSAKKASKGFSLKLEMPKLPWKRRNTTDTVSDREVARLRAQMNSPGSRFSAGELPSPSSSSSSVVPASPLDDPCQIRLSRSSSMTSSDSVEIDPDPNSLQSSSGYSSFDRLQRRRNGITNVSPMQAGAINSDSDRKRKLKARRSDGCVVEGDRMDRICESADDINKLHPQGSLKHKFFKRKAASVKR